MTYKEGTSYHGFTLEQSREIDELHSHVYLFRHDMLGCPLFAIKNSDTNKTFSVAFNTIPTDSTGVAHILEHSVLMGSEKYPVKDVFGELNKGGLTTFLNAMTGSDITYYPFATRNMKEYFNLMDVYCDVAFHPLLEQSTFEQEGWHYHKESLEGELQFQGVVFNEMKGAFSDPIRLIFHHIFGGLMPGSTYSHESGGDPKNIPDLTYQQFVDFHKKHYHPSNCTFFVYGDADLDQELQFLQSRFLANFTTKEQRREITKGSLTTELTFLEDTYGVESDDIVGKTFLAVGTAVSIVQDRLQSAAFQIIANILFNSDGSPLKKAIISSGLCKDFGGFYLSSSSFRTIMMSYLVGSEKENRDNFLTLYNSTLAQMVQDGLDRDLVISEINKYEFSTREDAAKSQRGLDLIGKAMSAFKYEANPFDNIVNEELIKNVRRKALDENYFEELINQYLLNNPSTVVVTLVPDPSKGETTNHEEQQRLQEHLDTLSKEEEDQLIIKTKKLMERQLVPNSEQTLSLLPRLELSDLPSHIDFHTTVPTEIFGSNVLISDLPTNRISYIDVGFDFSALPARLLPILDLFGIILTEIGTEKLNYMEFAKEIATCTGGFSHSVNTYMRKGSPEKVQPVFWLHTKCLPGYLGKTLEILTDVLTNRSFKDRRRISEIVKREFAWAEHSAQSEGYNFPTTRVFSHLSKAGRYNELINGVSSYLAIKDLSRNYAKEEEKFLADLQEIAAFLFTRKNLLMGFSGEQNEITAFSKAGNCLVDSLPDTVNDAIDIAPLNIPHNEAFITSAEIVFAVLGGNLLPDAHGYSGHFEVLKNYLSRDYLWNSVRQMGGAYGCFIQFSNITGNMAIVSYRDPQVRKTYEAYEKLPEIVESIDLSDKGLQQLIIGTYGNFDPLQSPSAKAAMARNEYLSGITPEFKRQRLAEIVSTSVADMRSYSDSFKTMIDSGHRSIIGNRLKIEADSNLFDVLTEI